MLINILSLIHNTTTLLFGVYASAAFLGIRMNRKNILALLTFHVLQVFLCAFFCIVWIQFHGTGLSFHYSHSACIVSYFLLQI